VSPINYQRWRERADTFESFGAFLGLRTNLTGVAQPQELSVHIVTQGFFETLGVAPLRGRTFSSEESTRPGAQVAVISYALWSARFGQDPAIVGRAIELDGRPVEVIGVMPADVRLVYRNGNGTKPPDLWTPFVLTPDAQRGRFLSVVGRIKPGVPIAQARAQMAAVAEGYSADFPNFKSGWTTKVVPLRDELAGEVKPALLVLAGAVTFVLLIACVNVANLLLARGAKRQHEIAVRSAIGAGRARVARQLLTETLLLCVLGGVAGLAVARATLQGLLSLSPVDIGGIGYIGLSYPVLAYTGLVSLVTSVLAGFAPAFETSRADFSALKNGIRQIGMDARRRRLRQALVISELSLAVVLLFGAGLMLRSFANMQRIDTGFDAHNVLTMRMTLPLQRYLGEGRTTRFFEAVTRNVRTLPGVQSAGVVSFLPFADLGAATDFTIEGRPLPPP
jgi:predicted permease